MMLLKLRCVSDNKLVIKDYLDIDFDMKVTVIDDNYRVMVNDLYLLDETYSNKDAAEKSMIEVAEKRNEIEEELRFY